MSSKKILVQISAIRLIAMILIISCHVLQYYNLKLAWWFNVGVQIFLVISGFLYGTKEIENPIEWIGKRFKKILFPYYLLLVCYITICLFCSIKVSFVEIFKALFCLGNLPGLSHLWFVSNILFCYIITPYLCEFVKKSKVSLIRIVFALIVYIIFASITNAYFRHHFICCYIIGFFIGHYYGQSGGDILLIKRLTTIFVFIAFIANGLRIIIEYIRPDYLAYIPNRIYILYSNYSHLLLGVALFLLLFLLFKHVKNNHMLKLSDKYSYDIYLTHHLFILSPFTVMSLTDCISVNIVIALIAAIASAILLHKGSTLIENRQC